MDPCSAAVARLLSLLQRAQLSFVSTSDGAAALVQPHTLQCPSVLQRV